MSNVVVVDGGVGGDGVGGDGGGGDLAEVHSPTLSISRLRLVKSDAELSLMRRAGELAGHAFMAVMRGSHAGVGEAQLESIFEHSVKMNGAQWMSYPPVVAGGNRANCLHYIANNRVVRQV